MGYKAWCCIALSALTLLFETLNPSFSLKGLLPQKSSGAKNAGKCGCQTAFFGGPATTIGNDRWEEYGFVSENKIVQKTENQISRLTLRGRI